MFAKIAVFAALVCLAAAQLPAGIDPVACPNYPFCDGVTYVAPVPAAAWPADVAPAACPDYPYCSSRAAAPIGYANTAGWPAGVAPAACPNFPYC